MENFWNNSDLSWAVEFTKFFAITDYIKFLDVTYIRLMH